MPKPKKPLQNKWLYSPAPGAFDQRAEDLAREIPTLFPGTSEIEDLELRMARYKRDLIYIGEAADTEQDIHFCMEFVLEMHFGVRRVPSMLDMPLRLNEHLRRRMNDLIRCYVPEPIPMKSREQSKDKGLRN
jgi:hypothetical protein